MVWFGNLKIRHKFLTFAGFILLFLLSLSAVGIWGSYNILKIVDGLNTDQIPELISIGQANTALRATDSYMHLAFMETDPANSANDLAKAREYKKVVLENLQKYIDTSHPADEAGMVQNIKTQMDSWNATEEKLIQLAQVKTPESLQEALKLESTEIDDELAENLSSIIQLNNHESEDIANNTFGTAIVALIIFSLFIIALTLGMVLILARTLSNPLSKLSKSMTALAEGDLTQQVETGHKDEIGELGETYNTTLSALRMLVEELHTKSQQIATATYELSYQARNQVTGGNQQASAISEITQALQELNETAINISEQSNGSIKSSRNTLQYAHMVSQTADKMAEAQEKGRTNVAHTIKTLLTLKEKVAAVESHQQALRKQSNVIQKVIGLINNISHETHLLSLNAAIEAAGAGEYGERFAVIAGEVKRLATDSVEATKEISKSLEGIALEIEQANQSASEGVEQVERATLEANLSDQTLMDLTELSNEVKAAARTIVTYIEQNTHLATSIGFATQQQQIASQQVLATMLSIQTVTAQNLSSIQQGDIATQQLSSTARELERSANIFKLAA